MSKNPKPQMLDDPDEIAIEQFKVKRLIKRLDAARGNGTSMISLVIPHKDDVGRHRKILDEEMGTATNIKSRVNRLSVLSAITSTQQRLKQYQRTPPNGLIIYCGEVVGDDGKEKKVTFDIQPFKPINTTLYMCDNRFHTECMHELLENDDRYGFLVMDGNGSLYGTLQGSHRSVLHKFSVDLPKKHGRGGQSAMRFARLRLEKRHNYVRKVGEIAVQQFITNDKPNINGLVLAGSAEFKTQLERSDLLDPRLLAIVIAKVDVSYGAEAGFAQAIELAGDVLANVKFIAEKKVCAKFFQEVEMDTGKFCFGVEDTMKGLEMGAVESLIIWEELDVQRIVLRNPNTSEETTIMIHPHQEKNEKLFKDEETGVELDVIEKEPLLEWVVENYKTFGAKLEVVSDRSQEGSQFVKGFGGMGGLLRYQCSFEDYEQFAEESDDSEDEWI